MRSVLLALTIAAPPGDGWFGVDKLKHFLVSAFVQSVGYSIASAAGADRVTAHAGAGVVTLGVGIWKEGHDRNATGFSTKDLAWDAAGALAAAALLNGAR